MSRPTNDPNPFLLEVDGLKPLSFDDTSKVADAQEVEAALETELDAEGFEPLAAMREPAGFGEMEVWPISKVDSPMFDESLGVQKFEEDDDFDADVFDDLP